MNEYIVKAYFITDGNELVSPEVVSELIRCENCIHHHGYYCDRLFGFQDAFTLRDEDFCSRAEREESEEWLPM